MKKRVLSMLMTLALCLTLFPAPAWAAEDTPEAAPSCSRSSRRKFARRIRTGWNE